MQMGVTTALPASAGTEVTVRRSGLEFQLLCHYDIVVHLTNIY